MPLSPLVQVLLAISAAGVIFAFWKGGPAERLTAACVVANHLAGMALAAILGGPDSMARFANDGLTALLLLAIAVRYASPWLIGVMFFFAAQFAMHSYYLVTGRYDRDYLHALINNVNNMGVLVCLVLGTAVAWRQKVRSQRPSGASPSPGRRP